MLAAVDTNAQSPADQGALVFTETPIVSGSGIYHQPGSSVVEITESGIYQAFFHSTIAVDSCTSIPASALVRLYLNGYPIPGASARRTITSTNEVATISFDVAFTVHNPIAYLEVIVDNAGFTFSDTALTVIRLGDLCYADAQ